MQCEIIAIGTELLLGQIQDTNSSWLGENLALIGIDNFYQSKIGDNEERIVAAIKLALSRSDAIICCGGLGPTQDDITREAIARATDTELCLDEKVAKKIENMFSSRGRHMTSNNLKQAMIPKGGKAIEDQPGTAPGIIFPFKNKVIYAVPGVPYELKQMMRSTILPDLKKRSGSTTIIKSRTLRTWGHTESKLAELLEPKIEQLNDSQTTTLAFLASGIEGLKLRITVKGETEDKITRQLDKEEKDIRYIIGDVVFGINNETIEQRVLKNLKDKNLTLSAVEVATDGLASTRLGKVDPLGRYFKGCIIPKTISSKEQLLQHTEKENHFSETKRLADAVRNYFASNIGLAITYSEEEGVNYLAISSDNILLEEAMKLPGDGVRVAQFSVITALNLLRLQIENDLV